MKKWLILPMLLSLTSCSMGEDDNFYHKNQQAREEIDSFEWLYSLIGFLAAYIAITGKRLF